MTDIFWIMLPAGYLNSIVVKEFPGKEITHLGLNKNKKDSALKRSKKAKGKKLYSVNLSG